MDTKMDKILLTAFLSALAGFITAVISVVKLVNEKESKTTDYRQSWTDSARKSLSELISNLNTQASLLVNIRDSVDNIKKTRELLANQNNDEIFATRISNLVDEEYKEEQSAIREMQREIYKSYAFTRLHFKPNDASFNRIEQKFDVIIGMLDELRSKYEGDKSDRKVLKEKIHGAVADLTNYARDILKTEWETVKRGETAYQATKRWSFIGGTVMLFILLSIGIHASISVYKNSSTSTALDDIRTKNTRQNAIPTSNIDVENAFKSFPYSDLPATQIITNNVQCSPARNAGSKPVKSETTRIDCTR